MRALLDTHVLIWAVSRSLRLSPTLRNQLDDPANEIFFSAASIWEVAIKHGRNRADFQLHPDELGHEARAAGFVELPIHGSACSLLADLPHHHRDPFDRLLIAQAMTAGLTLYTADAQLPQYGPCVSLVTRQAG